MLAKKVEQGEVGEFQLRVPCTWQLPCVAAEKPWLALAEPFLLFNTNGIEKAPLSLFLALQTVFSQEKHLLVKEHCKLANEWMWQRL